MVSASALTFLIHCVLIFAVVSLLWRASRQGSGIRDTRTGYGNAKACHYVRGLADRTMISWSRPRVKRDKRQANKSVKVCFYMQEANMHVSHTPVSYLGSQLRLASGASNRNVAAGMARACPSFEPGSLSGADASAQRKKWIHVDVARMTA